VDCILLSTFPGKQDAMNDLVGRIRAEFLEMPGLRLTVTQASRLWGLDEGSCRRVIDVLIGSSFLRWAPGGTVARADD
jgi:hypothetical protein